MCYRARMFAVAYARRLGLWASVARHIRGVSKSDRSALLRAIVRAPLTSLRNMNEWMNPAPDTDCRVTTDLGTFDVRANADDLYLTLPNREPGIVAAIMKLQPGDLFVDAGANIGVYTVLAAKRGAKVVAIEMMPDTANVLRKHIALNKCRNVTVIEGALSKVTGEIVEATVTPGKYGQASIAVKQKGRTVKVRTVTLGDVLPAPVKLLKLDLEGAELPALKGLGKHRPETIIFEDWAGDEVAEYLVGLGYSITRLDADNSLATLR
jgi:FkbM family methyltransferase